MKNILVLKIIKFIALIMLFILLNNVLKAQNIFQSKCTNSDFSLGDFTNWTGCYCINAINTCYTSTQNGSVPNCVPISPLPPIYCGNNGFYTVSSSTQPALHTIITLASINYAN